MFKASWIKSSLFLGAIFIILGLMAIFILKVFNFNSLHFFLNVKIFVERYGFIGIFLAAILAGTIVPLGSPALVTAVASFGLHPINLALVAAVGFTIGMVINYALAYNLGERYVIKKIGVEKFKEISYLWMKRGWVLYIIFGFIPALPIEFLSFFCGLLKMRFNIFLILTFIPRFIVFIILAYFGERLGEWLKIV
ncbi:DedA family protein [Candidatus Bathyarchaeota archaeon]|nr:DedA family protein [Candidatus Bathyarchaeota archaeon]